MLPVSANKEKAIRSAATERLFQSVDLYKVVSRPILADDYVRLRCNIPNDTQLLIAR